jgi:hypothetical protein
MNARRIRDIEYCLLPGTDRKTTDIVIERNGIIAVRSPKDLKPRPDRGSCWTANVCGFIAIWQSGAT